jgi:superoxide dismutase, Fe-Mn family
MPFTLPGLPYPYEALQPYLSRETLEFHHDKHHAGYVTNANTLLKDSGLEGKSLEEIVMETYGKNVPLFNNAAQQPFGILEIDQA